MISEESEFHRLKAVLRLALQSANRPPANVFAGGYHVVGLVEFDVGMTAKFWSFIRDLAKTSSDRNVFVVALEPDAEQYFRKRFGKYGAIRLSVTDDGTRYLDALGEYPDESPADSLRFNSEFLVWLSDTGSWVAWGSRGFSFVAVAFRNGFSANINELAAKAGVRIHETESAISDLIIPSFVDDNVAAQNFATEFRKNYAVNKDKKATEKKGDRKGTP